MPAVWARSLSEGKGITQVEGHSVDLGTWYTRHEEYNTTEENQLSSAVHSVFVGLCSCELLFDEE